jgi:hypothetical protein
VVKLYKGYHRKMKEIARDRWIKAYEQEIAGVERTEDVRE